MITHFRQKCIAVTDKRVRLMSEVITCIKLIKVYAWEVPFAKKIAGKCLVHIHILPDQSCESHIAQHRCGYCKLGVL